MHKLERSPSLFKRLPPSLRPKFPPALPEDQPAVVEWRPRFRWRLGADNIELVPLAVDVGRRVYQQLNYHGAEALPELTKRPAFYITTGEPDFDHTLDLFPPSPGTAARSCPGSTGQTQPTTRHWIALRARWPVCSAACLQGGNAKARRMTVVSKRGCNNHLRKIVKDGFHWVAIVRTGNVFNLSKTTDTAKNHSVTLHF